MINLLLVALCGFYITYVIRYTAGPFDVFIKFRHKVGIDRLPVLDGHGNIVDYGESIDNPDRFITKLVSCFWCFTTWITFVVSALYCLLFQLPLKSFPFLWLASAGLSAFLYMVIEG